MITKADLDNRLVGSAVGGNAGIEEPRRPRGRQPEELEKDVPSLRERLASARGLADPAVGCRACFRHGRDAVVELLSREDDARPLVDRLAAAAVLRPVHAHGGDQAFAHGRDAAVRVLAGEG